jgi:N-acetyl-anhydromuramyl-L-alanine amidase AmpD
MIKKTHIIIHHTGGEEKDTEQIYRYHTKSLGWKDIGYNFVIERDGTVVKGRPLNIRAAHCNYGNMNEVAIGVAIIGNFENHAPNENQIHSLFSLCGQLASYFRIEPKRIMSHK